MGKFESLLNLLFVSLMLFGMVYAVGFVHRFLQYYTGFLSLVVVGMLVIDVWSKFFGKESEI